MTSLEEQVRRKAEELWTRDGRPAGGPSQYHDRARQLMAAGVDGSALKPNPIREPERPEPVEAVENLGEFPGLTDQGEARNYPKRRGEQKD
ncbi:MAG: DUF2934 domain-containing protein [Alphaproteobacteria bacterium]